MLVVLIQHISLISNCCTDSHYMHTCKHFTTSLYLSLVMPQNLNILKYGTYNLIIQSIIIEHCYSSMSFFCFSKNLILSFSVVFYIICTSYATDEFHFGIKRAIFLTCAHCGKKKSLIKKIFRVRHECKISPFSQFVKTE